VGIVDELHGGFVAESLLKHLAEIIRGVVFFLQRTPINVEHRGCEFWMWVWHKVVELPLLRMAFVHTGAQQRQNQSEEAPQPMGAQVPSTTFFFLRL
jgi:hypothetical protein